MRASHIIIIDVLEELRVLSSRRLRNSSTISRQPTRTNPQGFSISRGERDKIPFDTVCANDECPLENSEQDRLLPWVVPQNPPDQYQRHFIEQTLSSFLPTSKLYIHTSNTCNIVYATYVCVWTIIGRSNRMVLLLKTAMDIHHLAP